jgi:hypothetical protein
MDKRRSRLELWSGATALPSELVHLSALPHSPRKLLVAFDPIKTLFWSAVINGVISVPIMVRNDVHGGAP